MPELENSKTFKLEREVLSSMLKSVSYAQSVNEERYMLKGVFFSEDSEGISLVTTDGKKIGCNRKRRKIIGRK